MRLIVAFLLGILAFSPFAARAQASAIVIEKPSTIATVDRLPTAGVFMLITNKGAEADRLIGVKTPRAAKAMIHETTIDSKGMARMRALAGLDVAAGKTVALAPAGYHIMLVDLTEGMKQGATFPLTLTFAKAGAVEVSVKVESPARISELFPPEYSMANVQKILEASEKGDGTKSWLDRLRERIQSFFRGMRDRKLAEKQGQVVIPENLPTREEMEKRQAMDALKFQGGMTPIPQADAVHAPAGDPGGSPAPAPSAPAPSAPAPSVPAPSAPAPSAGAPAPMPSDMPGMSHDKP